MPQPLAALFTEPLVAIGAALAASALMLAISILHFYWAIGGSWGLRASVPEWEGRRVFVPTPLAIYGIGFALLLAAAVMPGRVGLYGTPQLTMLYEIGPWVLAVIFFLRAVGDLRFVGFFKKVRFTYFAWWDNRLHSPLCLLLSLLCLTVALSPLPWAATP